MIQEELESKPQTKSDAWFLIFVGLSFVGAIAILVFVVSLFNSYIDSRIDNKLKDVNSRITELKLTDEEIIYVVKNKLNQQQ